MRVRVHRLLNRGMTEPFLDDFRVLTVRQRDGGHRMSEPFERDSRQVGLLNPLLEEFADPIRMPELAVLFGENVARVGLPFPVCKAFFKLPLTPLAEHVDGH